jgi:hypothetical protein
MNQPVALLSLRGETGASMVSWHVPVQRDIKYPIGSQDPQAPYYTIY